MSISKLRAECLPLGDYTLRFECSELGADFEQKAAQELRETPDVTEPAVARLKALLAEEDDLNVPKDDEEFLYIFLRPCKFYPESALKRMRSFYEFKLKQDRLVQQVMPHSVERPLKLQIITILPNRDQHGRRILLIHAGRRWKPSECSLDELYCCVMLFLEIAVSEPRTQIAGVTVILDLEGLSMTQAMQFSPSFAKMLLHWVQDCIPIRLKAIHVVNQPYIFNMVFAIFKPFIKEKLRHRLHFHGRDRGSLLEHIEVKALPTELGGIMNLPPPPADRMIELLESYEDIFEERRSQGYRRKDAST
ncbi:alpha-tocopherol transfer protein-like [Schistocerca cancellata]|uniref:alpha-tocopherol transfer protein-like n=1 Tax=Schistocerca cancellata TaxID=274614 RepID=UPI002117596F|nr:alpha-tocopherol transfer protein-like [Schistocerca cancellata]